MLEYAGGTVMVFFLIALVNLYLGMKNKETAWFNVPVGIFIFVVSFTMAIHNIGIFLIQQLR